MKEYLSSKWKEKKEREKKKKREKSRVAILASDKTDFKSRRSKDKEGHYIMVKDQCNKKS